MNELNLQEVLKENKERYTERLKQQREYARKEKTKELIIIAGASILILVLLFKALSNMNTNAMDNCLDKGYSEQTCRAVLG